jgi:hypothetical protein
MQIKEAETDSTDPADAEPREPGAEERSTTLSLRDRQSRLMARQPKRQSSELEQMITK